MALSVESGSDPAFVSGAAPASIEVEIEDDDAPGIVVMQEGLIAVPRTGLTIAENGESIDLLARLQVPSDGDSWTVVVDVASLGTGNIEVSTNQLTFTSTSRLTFTETNYSQSQRVTVTAIDDDFVRDDSDSLRFVVNQEMTTAADYRGAPRQSVRFTLANDDVGSIMLSASTLTVREDGSAAVGVRLGMSPGQQQDIVSLVVDELGANVRLSGAGASLVFTGNDWDQMRDLEIEAVDDNFLGNRTATLTVRVDPNQTGAYSDATVIPKSVDITVLSEDRAGLDFACDACSGRVTTQGESPAGSEPFLNADSTQAQTISLPEGGCVVYTVELTALPIGGREVVVRFPPGAGEDGFTYADGEDCGMLASLGPREAIDVALSASMPMRRFLVVASDDEVYSGPGTATATVLPGIVGTEFSGVALPELTVEISGDDDIPDVSFSALSASATAAFSEDDGVLVLPIRLSNPSQVPVTVLFGFDPVAEAKEEGEVESMGREPGDVDYDFSVNDNHQHANDAMTLVFEPFVVVLRDALRLEVLEDPIYEGDEDFELRMLTVVNGRPGEKLELTVFENEAPPSLLLRTTDTRVLVGADAVVGSTGIAEGVSPTIFVSVKLTGVALENVVVDLVVQGDTAQGRPAEPDDYRLRCLSGCSPVSVDAETGAAMVTVTLSRSAPVAVVEIRTTSDTETLDAEDIIITLENPTEGFGISSSGTLKLRVLEDNIAPVLPGDLEVDRVDGGSAELSWEQATDNRSAADALVYELYTAPAPVPSDTSIQGSRLFVHRLDPTEIETNADGTRFVFRVAGLYPLTQYAWTLTVTDEAGNVATHEDVTRSTSGPIDSDGDGLPDHFVAADGLAEDFDNDSLSDDLERFMSSGSATSARPTDDVNGNGIPDSVEIGLGFPALDALPEAYAAWTTPGAVGRQVLGSSTHTMAVTDSELLAAHLVEPYTQMTYSRAGTSLPAQRRAGDSIVRPWLRRGGLCGGNVLPSNYRQACTPAEADPSSTDEGVVAFALPAGIHRLWWIIEDDLGNWPLAGAATQTIYVVPRIRFGIAGRARTEARARIVAYLSGKPVVGDRFSVPFLVLYDDTGAEDLPVGSTGSLQFEAGATRGGADVTPGASSGTMVFEFDLSGVAFCSASATDANASCRVVEAGEQVPRQTPISGLTPGVAQGALATVVSGRDASYTLTVVEDDGPLLEFALSVQVRSVQSASPVSTVALDGVSNLDVQSMILNEQFNEEYDWNVLTDAPLRPDVTTQPASGPKGYPIPLRSRNVEPGLYQVGLMLSRATGGSAMRSVWLHLVDSVGTLRAVDRDRDGFTDQEEGWLDADMDGIPNYLDALDASAVYLPSRHRAVSVPTGSAGATETVSIPDVERGALTVAGGLSLSLGATALAASAPPPPLRGYVAEISAQDIRDYGDRGTAAIGAGVVADDPDMERVGIFDFIVSGYPASRDRADVTLPLRGPLPEDPEYRGYRSGVGWQAFDTGTDDRIASALRDERDRCPDPDDEAAWDSARGLAAGDVCVRISVRDGGPNDADGEVNGMISQLVSFDSAVASGIDLGDSDGSGSGAGCALAAAPAGADAALAALLALCLLRRRRMAPALAAAALVAAGALAPAAALAGEESWQEWGAGSSGLWRGVYAGAGLASTEIAPHVFGPRYRLSATRDSGPRLALGYRLASHWSLEGFWADLGEAEILDRRAERPASVAYRQRGVLLSYRRARPDWLGLGRGLEGLGVAWGWFVSAGWADQDAKCRGCEFSSVDEGQMTLGLGVDLATPGPWTVRVHYERYGDDSSAAALSWLFGAAASPRATGGWR